MNKTKKAIITLLLGVVALLGGDYAIDKEADIIGLLGGSGGGTIRQLTACSISTTSPTYLTIDGATTTCMFAIQDALDYDLNVSLTASNTLTTLHWVNYFTSDDNNSTRDWYPEKGVTVTSNILNTWGADALTNMMTPADPTASTTFHNIGVDGVRQDFVRVDLSVSGSNGAISIKPVRRDEKR